MNLSFVLNEYLEGRSLDRAQAGHAMALLIEEKTEEAVIASFLSLLRAKSPSPDEVAGFIDTLADRSTRFDVGIPHAIDTCGTGGDGKNTFNILSLIHI